MMNVECPGCRAPLNAGRWPAGASVICPGCSTIFTPMVSSTPERPVSEQPAPGAARTQRGLETLTWRSEWLDQHSRRAQRVRVSARALNIPKRCCCCGTPNAPGRFTVTATRSREGRFGSGVTRRWTFRLCRDCERWLAAEREARLTRRWLLGAKALIALCLAAPMWSLPWAWVTLPLALLAAHGAREIADRWQRSREHALAVQPHWQCASPPVEYAGWSGSVHTFYFACNEFRESFMAGNARKLVT